MRVKSIPITEIITINITLELHFFVDLHELSSCGCPKVEYFVKSTNTFGKNVKFSKNIELRVVCKRQDCSRQ